MLMNTLVTETGSRNRRSRGQEKNPRPVRAHQSKRESFSSAISMRADRNLHCRNPTSSHAMEATLRTSDWKNTLVPFVTFFDSMAQQPKNRNWLRPNLWVVGEAALPSPWLRRKMIPSLERTFNALTTSTTPRWIPTATAALWAHTSAV